MSMFISTLLISLMYRPLSPSLAHSNCFLLKNYIILMTRKSSYIWMHVKSFNLLLPDCSNQAHSCGYCTDLKLFSLFLHDNSFIYLYCITYNNLCILKCKLRINFMYLVKIPLVLFNPETNVSHDHNLDGRSYFRMYSAYANMLSCVYLGL